MAEAGAPSRTVLLLNGASYMGKSYAATAVLQPLYGVSYRKVDDLYTSAVTAAGMAVRRGPEQPDKLVLKDARRRARDRKFPSPAVREAFFRAFAAEFGAALREGRADGPPVVLEGGTLRRREEVAIILRCAEEAFGQAPRVVRATFVLPYARWLQNRVNRMLAAKLETAKLNLLSPENYERMVAGAAPEPQPGVTDRRLESTEDVVAMMTELGYAARVPDAARA